MKRKYTISRKSKKNKTSKRSAKKIAGAPLSNRSSTNLIKIMETERGINEMEFINKIRENLTNGNSNTMRIPTQVYVAIGSAIHEENDYSIYQSIPSFLPRSEHVLVILYDDFSNLQNKKIYDSMAENPNWTFLEIQRYRKDEQHREYFLRIASRIKLFIEILIVFLNEHRINNWYISNYVAFRDPNSRERNIYLAIFNTLKRFIEEDRTLKSKIFQWNYSDVNHILSINNQPNIKLRITP
jgi:hypothetical protein